MIFTVLGKPKPVNGISKASYHAVAAETALWRNQTAWVAKSKRPRPTAPVPCKITVATYLEKKGRAKLHDINASAFSIKGAIDGLVDAGVLIDDSPEYLASLELLAPVWADMDALSFTVEPV